MTQLYDIIKDININNVENFIETGCHIGNGIQCAINNNIKNIYSCDIHEPYVKECNKKFFDRASIFNMDSISFLNFILPKIKCKTLFWLDAHFPKSYGLDYYNDEYKFPLFEEIKTIFKLKDSYKNDIFIIDDIHVFTKDNPYYSKNNDYEIIDLSLKKLYDCFYEFINISILDIGEKVLIIESIN